MSGRCRHRRPRINEVEVALKQQYALLESQKRQLELDSQQVFIRIGLPNALTNARIIDQRGDHIGVFRNAAFDKNQQRWKAAIEIEQPKGTKRVVTIDLALLRLIPGL